MKNARGVKMDGEAIVARLSVTSSTTPIGGMAQSSPCVYVIGAGDLAGLHPMATRCLPGHRVIAFADYLSALGELGTSGAGSTDSALNSTPQIILGRWQAESNDLEATVLALRQLAPRAKIILIGEQPTVAAQLQKQGRGERVDSWSDRALRAGADRCLNEPVNRQVIETLLGLLAGGDDTLSTPRQIDEAASTSIVNQNREQASMQQPVTETGSAVLTPSNEQATMRGGAWVEGAGSWRTMVKPEELVTQVGQTLLQEVLRQPGMSGAVQAPAHQQGDAELGDVDLLEHILHRRSGFADLLLRLVGARCGLIGAQWALITGSDRAQAQAQVPAGRVSGEVNWNGRFLGVLHAQPGVDAGTLQTWAQWMSRWLAVEAQHAGLWDLALRDELTGAWNRRYFHRFLETLLQRAASERFRVTLMLFDIDDFKQYNDRFGHAAGDDILREASRLMRSVVRTHDVVARIGGDEFAVIFWDAQGPRRPHSQHPNDVRQAAQRFQQAIRDSRFPRLLDQSRGTLTISGGLASFPWDGRTPNELMERADAMCLESKRQGKNALTFGPGACREG